METESGRAGSCTCSAKASASDGKRLLQRDVLIWQQISPINCIKERNILKCKAAVSHQLWQETKSDHFCGMLKTEGRLRHFCELQRVVLIINYARLFHRSPGLKINGCNVQTWKGSASCQIPLPGVFQQWRLRSLSLNKRSPSFTPFVWPTLHKSVHWKRGLGKTAIYRCQKGRRCLCLVRSHNPGQVLAPHCSPTENPKPKQSAEGLNSKYGVLLIIIARGFS